jgi:hypothetical protein
VIGRMVTDDVDHRYARALGIVQVSKTVGKARPTMEQRSRSLSSKPCVAVRCPGRDAFKQAKHTAYARDPVESGDEMHLRIAVFADSTARRRPATNSIFPKPAWPARGQVLQRCVFNSTASRVAPVREAVISVATRSRIRTR